MAPHLDWGQDLTELEGWESKLAPSGPIGPSLVEDWEDSAELGLGQVELPCLDAIELITGE